MAVGSSIGIRHWSAVIQLAKSKGFELDPSDTNPEHKWACGVLDSLSDAFDDLYSVGTESYLVTTDCEETLMRFPYDLLRFKDCVYSGQDVDEMSKALYEIKRAYTPDLNVESAAKLDKISRDGYALSHRPDGSLKYDEEVVSVEGAGMSREKIEKALASIKNGTKSDSKVRDFLKKNKVKLSAGLLAILVGVGAIKATNCDGCREKAPVTDAGEKGDGEWAGFDIFETKGEVAGDTTPDENPAKNPYDNKKGETAPEKEDRTEIATSPSIFDPVENGSSSNQGKPGKLNSNANTEKQTSKPSDNKAETKDPSAFDDFDIFEHIDG